MKEKELMDYHPIEINQEEENYKKKKKRILRRIKWAKQRNHMFRYLTRHAGKGRRESVKRRCDYADTYRSSIH